MSEAPTFLSHDECKAIFDRCVALAKPEAGVSFQVSIASTWTASAQWARNRAFLTRDIRSLDLYIFRLDRGRWTAVRPAGHDDTALREAIAYINRMRDYNSDEVKYDTRDLLTPPKPHLTPTLWSETTAHFDGAQRGAAVQSMIAPAEAAGFLAAGELKIKAGGTAIFSTTGVNKYYPTTRVEVSTTVRHPKGTGSGWAGTDDFDIARIDLKALGRRAFEKCKASVNPAAIEPGRYTAILEPQAVADLWSPLMSRFQTETDEPLDRGLAESKKYPQEHDVPFGKGNFTSKIGDRVLDARLTVSADPMDPDGGFLPFDWGGEPFGPVRWIDQGILRQLTYKQDYALQQLGIETDLRNPKSWRMSGGTTPIDEMIATTKRGVLVTRFHGVTLFHRRSYSCTGYTRDGLWLIENGKISKPVKNFRFTESPLFVFNKVEQLGEVRRVFSPAGPVKNNDYAWIAPTLKVTDFNFTQLADAV